MGYVYWNSTFLPADGHCTPAERVIRCQSLSVPLVIRAKQRFYRGAILIHSPAQSSATSAVDSVHVMSKTTGNTPNLMFRAPVMVVPWRRGANGLRRDSIAGICPIMTSREKIYMISWCLRGATRRTYNVPSEYLQSGSTVAIVKRVERLRALTRGCMARVGMHERKVN